MSKLFVISNHNPKTWSSEQKADWEEILYLPFPNVDPSLSKDEVYEMAKNIVFDNFSYISSTGNVSVQGEFSLTYHIINFIKTNPLLSHVSIWVPTSERVSEEKVVDGKTVKTATFKFVRWREI